MAVERFSFDYDVYPSEASLPESDRKLLEKARQATGDAYAPYSRFRVGAAAVLSNGKIITGSNQENASFPAGLCAEGTVMATAASLFPGTAILDLAISYNTDNGACDHPITPCGICRQQLQEFRARAGLPIRLIMGGSTGEIMVIHDAAHLMPFGFKF